MPSADDRSSLYDARNGIHTGLTAILAWLAFRLAMGDETFSDTPAFAYMARLAPETTWAAVLWIVANAGMLGLATGNALVRLLSVLILATAHGVLAGCLMMSGGSIDSGTYAVIAGMGYYLAYRRARAGL